MNSKNVKCLIWLNHGISHLSESVKETNILMFPNFAWSMYNYHCQYRYYEMDLLYLQIKID